ncbi:hypothetical protein G9C85_09630 [Halorubellus sp. JP-L1]|uniref:hypothetical protein n=1 Tax=Halorubellus sp. JP-L1 TaxID=2715753 RepID=UPI00140A4B31|nr:hypothetical protein [Halorubellus sp. JP-L1]NHN41887.1 hypothetical protein [Halorubellus sp. JP-L1]
MLPRLRLAPSTLFVAGVVLLVVATGLAVGAVRFEFAYVGVTANVAGVDWVVAYADLTPTDRALVRAAIDGDPYVTDSIGALPGPGRGSIAVFYDGAYHEFARRTYVAPLSTFGLASLSTATAGVAVIVAAFRGRNRRPNYLAHAQ